MSRPLSKVCCNQRAQRSGPAQFEPKALDLRDPSASPHDTRVASARMAGGAVYRQLAGRRRSTSAKWDGLLSEERVEGDPRRPGGLPPHGGELSAQGLLGAAVCRGAGEIAHRLPGDRTILVGRCKARIDGQQAVVVCDRRIEFPAAEINIAASE